MNLKRILAHLVAIMLAVSVISGCSATKGAKDRTTGKLVQASMNDWRVDYNDNADIRITFSPGKQCSVDILKTSTTYGLYIYEIVVNDQTYQNYAVVTMTMDEGRTLKDLEDFDKTSIGVVSPPSFSQPKSMEIVPPMSRTLHAVIMPKSPIYVGCMIQSPVEQQVIEEFGPIDVGK